MQYEVEIGGKVRQVVVTRTGGAFAVSVDGRTRQVDAVRVDANTLSLLVDSLLPAEHRPAGQQDARANRVFEVSSAPGLGAGELQVHVGSAPVAVTLNGRRRWGQKQDGRAGSGPQRVIAPMPGKIVRVLVNAGDRVSPRQPVVVVEAMKMENELRASREGTIAEIHVRQGMSVDAGTLLLVIQ
jgi:biotin carboxyl carrier protein